MNKKLKKIKDIIEDNFGIGKYDYIVTDEDDFQALDYPYIAHFSIEDDGVALSFYSGLSPDISAQYIKLLYENKIKDFEIYENVYPNFNKEGKGEGMLFGDEADMRYEEELVLNITNKNKENKSLQ